MPDNPQDATIEETTPSQGQPLESPQGAEPIPPKADTPPAPPLPGEDLAQEQKAPTPPSAPPEEPMPPPAQIIATPKPPSRRKIIVGTTILLFFLASISAGVFLVRQRQETRRTAAEKQLVCMPIDDNGNITNDKYKYNRIKVTNNTDKNVILWIQENLCDYEGQEPAPPYICNQYDRRYNDTINAGESKTYSIEVPCEKIGQLDVAQDDERMGTYIPDCYNSIDGKVWEGGIAFTIQANKEPCPTLTPTPGLTSTPTPTTTPSPTATPPLTTPTPTPTAKPAPAPESSGCETCRVYDSDWEEIEDFSTVDVGDKIYFATYGTVIYASGQEATGGEITKAKFRINGGAWQETEETRGDWECVQDEEKPTCTSPEFYIAYTIPSAGSYTVESMVYDINRGWQ